jgi:hypothetical protein
MLAATQPEHAADAVQAAAKGQALMLLALTVLRSSSIYYTIKAELDVQGIFSKDPKTKAGFQLLQRPTGVQAMPLHAQEQADITGCCCSSKGAVMVQADAATNIVRAGDTLGVTVQVRSELQPCVP